MRFGVIKDFLGSAMSDKFLQNLSLPGILCSRVQLTVGKGTRAAFTELNIGLHIQRACQPESVDIRGPAFHITAALNNNRLCAALCENQPRKQAGRSHTDYDRGGASLPFGQMILIRFRLDSIFCSFEYFVLIDGQFRVEGTEKEDMLFFSRVYRASGNAYASDRLAVYS